jgi:hypothetical protein
MHHLVRKTHPTLLIKSFDKLRTNGEVFIPFRVSLSNHERNQLVQRFLKQVTQYGFVIQLVRHCKREQLLLR